jgi:hypothetical protein
LKVARKVRLFCLREKASIYPLLKRELASM